jgi:hypothetical protein
MVKLVGWMVLLGAVFAAGYYAGQHPVGELRKTLADLSRNVRDSTLGLERNMRLRQGLVDAKAEVIQAKSELLDKNFGHAAASLGRADEHLEKAESAERDGGKAPKVRPIALKVQEAHLALTKGKAVPRGRLDEIQKELDALLK